MEVKQCGPEKAFDERRVSPEPCPFGSTLFVSPVPLFSSAACFMAALPSLIGVTDRRCPEKDRESEGGALVYCVCHLSLWDEPCFEYLKLSPPYRRTLTLPQPHLTHAQTPDCVREWEDKLITDDANQATQGPGWFQQV